MSDNIDDDGVCDWCCTEVKFSTALQDGDYYFCSDECMEAFNDECE